MAKKDPKEVEIDERDTVEFLYHNSNEEVIDKKIEQFMQNGIKFIRYSVEIPATQPGKIIKHDIVMTVEAFNKLSATNKKLFMGGLK